MPSDNANGADTIDAFALLPLPSLDTLTDQQVRGTACVWDGIPLANGVAVDLESREATRAGQPFSWFPRGCRKCVHDQAYRTLLDHAPSCEQCVDDAAQCGVGLALRRLMREYRR